MEAPVEMDLAGKRQVMRIFNDADFKPYPSREIGQLSEQFVWHVPMGLWRPVLIEQVGHVVAEWLHCETRVEDGDLARLALRTRLRNLDGRIMTGELSIRVSPENFQGGPPLEMKRALRLAGQFEHLHDVVGQLLSSRAPCHRAILRLQRFHQLVELRGRDLHISHRDDHTVWRHRWVRGGVFGGKFDSDLWSAGHDAALRIAGGGGIGRLGQQSGRCTQ